MDGHAFYCVSDDAYFLGAVGLINSLRLVGHEAPIVVLDCGLTPWQRQALDPHVTLLQSGSDAPPWLLKTVAPRERPADVMVLLDTDMVATRPLTPLIDEAASGRVVAFENPVDRFVPEWGELLGLGTARRQSYVGSGAISVGRNLGDRILTLMDEHQTQIDFDRTFWRRNEPDYPFLYGDQDVFNAVLATQVDRDAFVALDQRLAPTPPFSGLRIIDEGTLRCSYDDGVQPYLVHHFVVKPWLEATYHGVYSRLLRRLLIGRDVSIQVPQAQLPVWMRRGPRAYLKRATVNARELVRWHLREPISSALAGRRGARQGDR